MKYAVVELDEDPPVIYAEEDWTEYETARAWAKKHLRYRRRPWYVLPIRRTDGKIHNRG